MSLAMKWQAEKHTIKISNKISKLMEKTVEWIKQNAYWA
jgi:hypothetical protein